jgi:hypothetical protein
MAVPDAITTSIIVFATVIDKNAAPASSESESTMPARACAGYRIAGESNALVRGRPLFSACRAVFMKDGQIDRQLYVQTNSSIPSFFYRKICAARTIIAKGWTKKETTPGPYG